MPLLLLAVAGICFGFPSLLTEIITLYAQFRSKKTKNKLRSILWNSVERNTKNTTASTSVAGIFIIIGVFLSGLFFSLADVTQLAPKPSNDLQVVKTTLNCPSFEENCPAQNLAILQKTLPDVIIAFSGTDFNEKNRIYLPFSDPIYPDVLNYLEELSAEYGKIARGFPSKKINKIQIFTFLPADYAKNKSISLLNLVQKIDFVTTLPALSIDMAESENAVANIYKQQVTWLILFLDISFLLGIIITFNSFIHMAEKEAREFAILITLSGKGTLVANYLVRRLTWINGIGIIVSLCTGIYLAQQLVGEVAFAALSSFSAQFSLFSYW